MNTMSVRAPHEGLLRWLQEHGVEHQLHEHPDAYTAASTARAEGVDARTFAKVVGVATDDGRTVLLVLDAPDHVDLRKARTVLDAGDVRLLSEKELAALAPGCDAGAMPAVGALFGVPMFVDDAVKDDEEISFNAGTHRYSVRVDRSAWEHAADVHYSDLVVEVDRRPAWIRS